MSSPHDIITIQNIDSEDFIFGYGTSEGNPPYLIPAGEVKRFPRFLAEHAVGHLIDQILTRKKVRTNNGVARQELAAQIILQEETFETVAPATDSQKTQKEVEMLNNPSDLDKILATRKVEPKPAVVVTEPVVEDKPKESFVGLEEKVEELVTPVEPVEVKTEPTVKAMPTRNELLGYAEKEMKLVMDQPDKDGKTLRQVYTKMQIPDLIKELNYPTE